MWKTRRWACGLAAVLVVSLSAAGQVQQKLTVVVQERGDRRVYLFREGSQPQRENALHPVAAEVEQALAVVGVEDPSAGLAALDTAMKAVMKARRLLGTIETEGKTLESTPAEAVRTVFSQGNIIVSVGGGGVHHIVLGPGGLQTEGRPSTRLEGTRRAARDLARELYLAVDVDEAREVLDEVDELIIVLRELLWKKRG